MGGLCVGGGGKDEVPVWRLCMPCCRIGCPVDRVADGSGGMGKASIDAVEGVGATVERPDPELCCCC